MDFEKYPNMTTVLEDGTVNPNVTVQELSRMIRGYSFDAKLVCSKANDFSRDVVKPIMEAGMQTFLNACAKAGETLLPSPWSLCDKHGYFDCSGIHAYTTECLNNRLSCDKNFNTDIKQSPESTGVGPGRDGFRMEMLMEDTSAIVLLVGLVLLGILIGVALTIAVCLVWPNIHGWANSKLRPEKSPSKTDVFRGDSAYTSSNGSYYEIDSKMSEANIYHSNSHKSNGRSISLQSNSSSSKSHKPRLPPLRHSHTRTQDDPYGRMFSLYDRSSLPYMEKDDRNLSRSRNYDLNK